MSGQWSRAITLVEIVLVLGIITHHAGLAAPRYAASLANYRVRLAAHRLASDVALAQAAARASSGTQTVTFDLSKHSYTVSGVSALDGRTGAYTVQLLTAPYG